MQPTTPNPALGPMPQDEVLVLSERVNMVGYDGFHFCFNRCITHFGEDSLPYHHGEKACMDRCLCKVDDGLTMAIRIRKEFNQQLKAGELPYQWMRDAAEGKITQ